MEKVERVKFIAGNRVQRSHGYKYPGIVLCVFETLDHKIRYVVEAEHPDFRGMLHIFGNADLEERKSTTS